MPVKTVVNEKYGYRQLAEIPDTKGFYETEYFTKKLDKPTEKEKADKLWLRQTLYYDIATYLKDAGCKTVLDVGCGKGWLVEYLWDAFTAVGIDPGGEDGQDLESYYPDGCKYDAIIMLNVLEHVPNPEEFLTHAKRLLKPGGHLICQVPNDFSHFQSAAKKGEYWVVSPDHINYFNNVSLMKLFDKNGITITEMSSDFPIEMFLLMGIDYINEPIHGKDCHEMRVKFETSISPTARQIMYRAFGKMGIGRNVIAYAQKRAEIC